MRFPINLRVSHFNIQLKTTYYYVMKRWQNLAQQQYQKLAFVNNKNMFREYQTSKFQQWLLYSPLIYNHLIMTPSTNVASINSIKWLRGVTNSKLSFKYLEGFACVVGSTTRIGKVSGFDGGFSIYRTAVVDDQDDDRLQHVVKLRSHWRFKEQIGIFEQYGNSLENIDRNNMFAIAYKNQQTLLLMPTTKLLQDGVHSNYGEDFCSQLSGHQSPITCIKWANYDCYGHKIFTASTDCKIMQWDIQKITLQRQLKYHRGPVHAMTPLYDYTPSWGQGPIVRNPSSTLASASQDGYIFIWDQRNGTPAQKINPKQKQLYSIDCISQKCLISGGHDGTIKIFDIRHQKQYLYEQKSNKVEGHTRPVTQIKVNRAGFMESPKNKNESGRVKFTSSDEEGKIIEWQDKIQFVHEGHENRAFFDLSDANGLCLSAERGKNVFMIWQSGVSMCQSQA